MQGCELGRKLLKTHAKARGASGARVTSHARHHTGPYQRLNLSTKFIVVDAHCYSCCSMGSNALIARVILVGRVPSSSLSRSLTVG
jgi:hypothetical protein